MFKPIPKLEVRRAFSDGSDVLVGVLAQNKRGVFFQYDVNYLANFPALSPFNLQHNDELQLAPQQPHAGLHGAFADSLPDGWGLLLQDRVFRQHEILPAQVTAMDRLAFVGSSAMGALSFVPSSEYAPQHSEAIELATLGLEAQALFDGQTEMVLAALVAAGSSGGARPKAQLYFSADDATRCRTLPKVGDEAWLVKFTSENLALGHEEGLCEATYLTLAERAGLVPPQWRLLEAPGQSGASHWLALKRFDYVQNVDGLDGRLHMQSSCGLLDADFRSPSLDYEDLIKASRVLCQSPAAGRLQFRRALFNLFACNQDDHSKNWAFLQSDGGVWTPAPFYDVTFNPHAFGEHATSFVGYGKSPPLKAVQSLAETASFASWQQAQEAIVAMVDVLAEFGDVARGLGVSAETIRLIEKQLAMVRRENQQLLA